MQTSLTCLAAAKEVGLWKLRRGFFTVLRSYCVEIYLFNPEPFKTDVLYCNSIE